MSLRHRNNFRISISKIDDIAQFFCQKIDDTAMVLKRNFDGDPIAVAKNKGFWVKITFLNFLTLQVVSIK